MAASTRRGADALAQAIALSGAKQVFTLSGNHVMPVFDASLDARLPLFHVRHEAAAVHMADAWARLTGKAGVALVTGGPGFANAVAALYTAAMAESPVVLLSGHAPNGQLGKGAFQEMRQAEIAAPLTKASWACASADAVAADFAQAVRVARSGRPGPVHLALPTDALEDETESFAPDAADFEPLREPPPAGEVAAMALQMRAASRPLVLAGPRFASRQMRRRLEAFERASGVPAIVMESPRGVADPSLGAFAAVLGKADAVLLLGKRLDFTLKFGKALGPACAVMQVDAEYEEIARSSAALRERLGLAARGDPADALEMLTRGAQARATDWLAEVKEAIAYRPAAWNEARGGNGTLHPVQALRPLQQLLDTHPDAVLVSDGGEIGQWAQACLAAPHRVINGVAGSIGAALPFALAARVAKPEAPIVTVMGDGTFGFHPAEIDTAVRYGLAFVAVVGNDARWNAEHQIQLRDYGPKRTVACELLPTRYDQVASAFGGHGEWVTAADDLLPAARRALASALPAVLNVMIEGLPAPDIKR